MRTNFTAAEIAEARRLLIELPEVRLADQRMGLAQLRHMGIPSLTNGGEPTVADLDALLDNGNIVIDSEGLARAGITPHPSGQIFRVAVGVSDNPVGSDWSAFDQRY